MKWTKFLNKISLVLFFTLFTTSVFAYDEPGINLGFTSFYDGMPPAGNGFYFEDYLRYYTANRLNGNNGDPLPLPKSGTNLGINVFQFIYLTELKVFGANLGFDVLFPLLFYAKVQDGLGNTVLKAENGWGDMLFGPILQFDPIKGKDGPCFVQRLEFDFIAPTGRYNRNYAITPSSHFWSFNPYWAATFWITKKWATSLRVHYLWNWVNTDPFVGFGPMVHSTQAGQAAFVNFTTEYEIIDKLNIGLNGYVLNQFTDTKANGINVPGRRESVWAIGPGLLYSFSKDHNLFLNIYFETIAKNRPQGSSYQLRYVYHFPKTLC